MKELFTLWRHTRMVVLVALTATLYAAILIPFKVVIPFMPGITEFRPANVIPVVCSLFFGPAAAWGAAFGNLIGDFFGTLGLGSIFGFVGNFLYGYLPYKMWGRLLPMLSRPEPEMRSARQPFEYLACALAASAGCALVIGWGLDLIGMAPFSFVGNVILLNNLIVSAVLGPPLLAALYPRVKQWGLLYTDTLEKGDLSSGRLALVGVLLVWVAIIWGMIMGNLASIGVGGHILVAGTGAAGQGTVALQAAPPVALLLVACLLL